MNPLHPKIWLNWAYSGSWEEDIFSEWNAFFVNSWGIIAIISEKIILPILNVFCNNCNHHTCMNSQTIILSKWLSAIHFRNFFTFQLFHPSRTSLLYSYKLLNSTCLHRTCTAAPILRKTQEKRFYSLFQRSNEIKWTRTQALGLSQKEI